MPSFFSIRKVQLYAELLDYSHDDDSGPYKTGGGSWGDFDTYEDNYEDRSYHALVRVLHRLYDQLEELELPGGF
jgi:hypothetical protein